MAQAPARAATPTDPGFVPRAFENQTLRQIAHISLGGQRVRIRVSNAFGTQSLRIGSAHVALQSSGAAIVPGSDRTLKFSGLPSISVPAGAVALSDPIDLNVSTQANFAVSLYLPTNTGPATFFENTSQAETYVSGPGDFTGAVNLQAAEQLQSRYFLSVVEVAARGNAGTVVAIGDSVTKGATATNLSWPSFLFSRLNAQYGTQKLAVINQGIGCGRILRDFCGPNASARFDRDVLSVTGATHVIVALGLVDIILPSAFGIPSETASASEIIQGLKQIIERAHAKDLTVYGATITPVGSSIFPNVYTPENEATRKAVNRWIRTSGAFDEVIDFDAAVRDPNDPTRYQANYTVDGIHPNDAGSELMANAVDLRIFE
jgi:lysophospholipase L1-like esterase